MKLERMFRGLSNKKGRWCPFKPIFCQEGYCHKCQIYHEWQRGRGNGASVREGEVKK